MSSIDAIEINFNDLAKIKKQTDIPTVFFKKVDKNGDGLLSLDEAKAMAEEALSKNESASKNGSSKKKFTFSVDDIEKEFAKMDLNSDGFVSLDEFVKKIYPNSN